jgi:arabinose-5-phosphate isomerase
MAEASSGNRERDMDVRIVSRGQQVLRIESESVAALIDRLDRSFIEAVYMLHSTRGRVVVTGIGKSGIVARKLASTLSSTGTPAAFLHPAEAVHGDVGMLVPGDLVLAISKSGESDELADLVPAVKHLDIPVLILTAEPRSSLARKADLVLDSSVQVEACPHDLTPTASSTAALAMGDALAMALVELRDFGPEDFARLHPGGDLGRRLLWRVRDVMLTEPDQLPRLTPEQDLSAATHEIAHRRGTVPVLDGDDRVVAVLTAGDLTRFADRNPDFLGRRVSEAMNRKPKTIGPDALATEAVQRMEKHGIMALPVTGEDGRLVGIVHLHDLLRARLS